MTPNMYIFSFLVCGIFWAIQVSRQKDSNFILEKRRIEYYKNVSHFLTWGFLILYALELLKTK